MKWSIKQLAHACDVVVHGLQSKEPFSGNPAFVEAFQVLGRLLRGDERDVRGVLRSVRSDGTYLLLKPADEKPMLNLRDE